MGAAGAAEFGAVAVAVDLEFLDRVERGVGEEPGVAAPVEVGDAVDGPHVGRYATAADRHAHAADRSLVGRVEAVQGGDAGHELGELQEIAAIERQITDLCGGDPTRDLATGLVGRDGVVGGRDLVVDGADLEDDVQLAALGDVELDSGDHRRSEAAVRNPDLEASNREIAEQIDARPVGRGGPPEPGLDIPDGNGCLGHDGPRRVGDRTLDARCHSLRGEWRGAVRKQHNSEEGPGKALLPRCSERSHDDPRRSRG